MLQSPPFWTQPVSQMLPLFTSQVSPLQQSESSEQPAPACAQKALQVESEPQVRPLQHTSLLLLHEPAVSSQFAEQVPLLHCRPLQQVWPLLQSPPEFWQKASQVLLLPGSQTSPSQQVWPSLQSAALTAQPLTQTLLVQVKPSQQGSSKLQVSPSPMQLPVQV